MTARHTHSPWSRNFIYKMLRHADTIDTGWEDGVPEGEHWPCSDDTDLIAAAPDLLEALETFADPRNWDWQEDYYAGSVALWVGKGDPVKIAKDAIAKATGGEE